MVLRADHPLIQSGTRQTGAGARKCLAMNEHSPEIPAIARAAASGALPGHAVSLGLTALVTVLGKVLFERGNIANVGLLYLLPVMVAATRYGLRTGVVTSLVSSLAYNFFFIPPTHTFTIEDPQNIITVLVLLGVAIAGSQLASRLRDQALLAQASSTQNSLLASFARQLTGISALNEVAEVLCTEAAGLLDSETVLLVPGGMDLVMRASSPPGCRLDMLDVTAARWALDHAEPAGRGSDVLTECEWLFRPLGTGGTVLAIFGMARPDARAPVTADQMLLLISLLDQAALALERITLEQEMAALEHVRERDRLRHALLSSVSHDLRTPLTTVLGTLGDMRALSGEQEQQLATARSEAERLHRFVDNLLDMVRIEAGALHQGIEPVDLSEAVASAVHDLRGILEGRTVDIAIPPDLPLVMVDPQLFHHCLINLIENAAKYGGSDAAITIEADMDETGARLSIMDEGPGIPAGEEVRIFETFARIEGSDRKGGTGLGLAIVKGFAEAMGLMVSAADRRDGAGACFTLIVPASRLKELSAQ